MPLRGLFFFQLAVIAALGVLHVSALYFSLYWHFVWLDTVSHFLGGVWVALAYGWLMLRLANRRPSLLEIVVAVLCVGLCWEVFEVAFGIPREANWAFDTALDLLMDVIGGLAGVWTLRRLS